MKKALNRPGRKALARSPRAEYPGRESPKQARLSQYESSPQEVDEKAEAGPADSRPVFGRPGLAAKECKAATTFLWKILTSIRPAAASGIIGPNGAETTLPHDCRQKARRRLVTRW